MLFNTALWTWGQKTLCRKKHLLTLCSENVKHSPCFRRASILHGRGKLHISVSGQAWPSQSLGYRGFLLSEVVLPSRVGGKAKPADLRSQAHGEFSSLTSAHLSGSPVSFWLLVSALWISHQPTSLMLLPTLFLFLTLPSTTCNVRPLSWTSK